MSKLGLIQLGGMTFLQFFHLDTGQKANPDWSDFHISMFVSCFFLCIMAVILDYREWLFYIFIFFSFYVFYEGSGDANHPCYCSPLCGSVNGPIFRPF